MVIDFSATWCGPCRLMEPSFNAMASKYTDVEFVKIDVDELSVRLSPSSNFASTYFCVRFLTAIIVTFYIFVANVRVFFSLVSVVLILSFCCPIFKWPDNRQYLVSYHKFRTGIRHLREREVAISANFFETFLPS